MNHKSYTPDEATLMAYFYDELKGAERQQVEAYLVENPEAQATLEEMRSTQSIMGKLSDKEAGQPLILIDENNAFAATPIAQTPAPKAKLMTMGFARTLIGVAAAIVLVFLMGALTNLQIKSGNEGLAISFGKEATQPTVKPRKVPPTIINKGIDRQEVEKLLSAYMASYGDSLSDKLGGLENKIVRQNQRLKALPTRKKVASNQRFSITEVQMMLDNLKKDHLKTMVDLIRLSNKNQKDYVGRAIADYARYVDDQRESDLKNIHLSIRTLADNTNSKQLQSDRLLAKVIEKVNRKSAVDDVTKR
ncbi:anti-sigma factor family protein [Microscilla marina]|uniref:Zinc-finger domain-containing protein n=1 Tax=Microscilla marina ATCC 23134 TaxID=313606 RepID=A1ZQJ1_MICM2|nr:hypothetical protein [Microscilla marina]EAY27363.1 hypothetical protein M23134_08315 [Microscilla marina ATCC 23134]